MAMAASSSVGGADESDERSESECAILDVMGEVMRRTRVGAGTGSVTSVMALAPAGRLIKGEIPYATK